MRADHADVGSSVPEPFTDPLSAVLPDGATRARTRLRIAGALLFGSGAVTLWSVLFAPDPDTADHPALAVCAAVYAVVALALLLWRGAPRAVLHAICPAGTVAATAAVALAEPIGLTPCFYLWPMIVAAYFLDRREVAANLAFAFAACAISLTLWVEPGLRLAMFVAVVAIVGVATAVIVVLREQVLALVLRLRTLASHDSLTGALNRGAFEQRLESELARARRSSTALSLVIFDVDHFKRLNDSFGHAAGDAALRGIGDVVAAGMRRSDVFGRLGGEEFGGAGPRLTAPGIRSRATSMLADAVHRQARPGIRRGAHEFPTHDTRAAGRPRSSRRRPAAPRRRRTPRRPRLTRAGT